MAFQVGDCSKMGVVVGRSPASMVFAAGEAHGMRDERRSRGPGWGSAFRKRRRRRCRQSRGTRTSRRGPAGFGEGFPGSEARRCSACADLCRGVSSLPLPEVSLLSSHFALPCELAPPACASLSPAAVSPSSPPEGQPSTLLQPL